MLEVMLIIHNENFAWRLRLYITIEGNNNMTYFKYTEFLN